MVLHHLLYLKLEVTLTKNDLKLQNMKKIVYLVLSILSQNQKRKKLNWTDLKLGDVVKQKGGTISYLIVGIDSEGTGGPHILIGKTWVEDVKLCDFVKVEE